MLIQGVDFGGPLLCLDQSMLVPTEIPVVDPELECHAALPLLEIDHAIACKAELNESTSTLCKMPRADVASLTKY